MYLLNLFHLTRHRAQVIIMFPAAFMVLILLATLSLDGTMMQQTQRDLETIATHAARAGAQQVDWAAYQTNCNAYLTANPTANVLNCNSFLILNQGAADGAARTSVTEWLTQLSDQSINFPGFAPKISNQVDVSFSSGGKAVTVTVRRCYEPFLFHGIFDSPDCPNAVLVVGHYTASPLAGL
jgi:hypothetical protein